MKSILCASLLILLMPSGYAASCHRYVLGLPTTSDAPSTSLRALFPLNSPYTGGDVRPQLVHYGCSARYGSHSSRGLA